MTRQTRVQDVDDKPWWRYGMVWLVIGGPLAVVVAATATAVIAIRGADVVIEDAGTHNRNGAHAPAIKARNHAATPTDQ